MTVPPTRVGRLPLVPADAADPALAAVFDTFRDAGRDVPALYRALANAPAMLSAWTSLAWPLRNECTTARGLRELVIMRVAQLTDASFEWGAHWDMAVKHGITPEQLAELGGWPSSDRFDGDQQLVLAMTDELTRDLDISEPTWAALAERFASSELVELVLTASYYSCVSRVLRGLRLEPELDPADPRLVALRGGA